MNTQVRRGVRLLRLGAAGAFGGALLLALLPGVAGASTPVRSGWWDLTLAGGGPPPTTVPATTLPTLPPTTLPGIPGTTVPQPPATSVPQAPGTTLPSKNGNGSLEVGYDGAGDTAIAAVEYSVPLDQGGTQVDPKTIDALLTLTLPTAGAVGIPTLLACPTTSSWAAGDDQPAKKAPRFQCAGGHASTGIYDSGSGAVMWNLSWPQESAAQPGVFSVVIVPGGKARGAPFMATFDKPDAQSFELLSWAPAGTSGSTPPVTEPPPPAPVPAGSGSGAGAGGSSAGSGTPSYFGGGAPTSAGSGASSSPSVGGGSSPAASGSGAPRSLSLFSPKLAKSVSSILHYARDVAIGLLIGLGVLMASASNRKRREPRLLVPIPVRAGSS